MLFQLSSALSCTRFANSVLFFHSCTHLCFSFRYTTIYIKCSPLVFFSSFPSQILTVLLKVCGLSWGLFFFLWISNYSSTICWKDNSSSVKLLSNLCQEWVSYICLGYFLVLYFVPMIHVSIPLPIPPILSCVAM